MKQVRIEPHAPHTKLYLTVENQRALLDASCSISLGNLLSRLILSTGIHPAVLSKPNRFSLQFDDTYYSYKRPKSLHPVSGAWSTAMRENDILLSLRGYLGRSTRYYQSWLEVQGKRANAAQRLGPLQLRHTYFVNKARLGTDAFTIAHASGTSIRTIMRHYTVGMAESKRLTDDERRFLEWLMDP